VALQAAGVEVVAASAPLDPLPDPVRVDANGCVDSSLVMIDSFLRSPSPFPPLLGSEANSPDSKWDGILSDIQTEEIVLSDEFMSSLTLQIQGGVFSVFGSPDSDDDEKISAPCSQYKPILVPEDSILLDETPGPLARFWANLKSLSSVDLGPATAVLGFFQQSF
jgi:hypothetical protein